MSHPKLSRRRFTTLMVVLALLGASIAAQLAGRHDAQEKVRRATRLAHNATRALVLTERLRGRLVQDSAPAAAAPAAREPAVTAGLLEEHGVAVRDVLADLAEMRREAYERRLREEATEWQDLAAGFLAAASAERRGDLAAATRLLDHLDSLEDALEEGMASATAVLLHEHAFALRWLRVGLWCTAAAVAAALLLAAGVASEMLQEALGPVNLEAELAELAETGQFQARMALLSSCGAPAAEATPWDLRLERVISERRTHVVFHAVASRAGEDIPLWGKRYKWTGHLKSLQRLFWPAYATATWEILSTMHSRGMGGPVPIACRVLRIRRLPVGSILLAQRVGPTCNLRAFLANDYPLLAPEQRLALVRELARFVRRLHDAGVYDLSPRYYHGTGIDGPPERMRLYLFDLDKARIALSPPAWLARMRHARDERRLIRLLRRHATHQELATLRTHLRAPAGEPPPTPPRTEEELKDHG